MLANLVEWIALLFFLLLLIGATIAEMQWLIRKGWAMSNRAIVYVLVTNFFGLGGSAIAVFVVALFLFMMVMGPAGRGSDTPDIAYWAVSSIAVVCPPLFLILIKRLCLAVFKISSGRSAWLYSLVVSILILLIVAVPPPVFFYLMTLWK
jgi:hypothetical protein